MAHPQDRRPASRQTAKASTSRSSSVSPAASRLRNLSVCSRSSASVICCRSTPLVDRVHPGLETLQVAGVEDPKTPVGALDTAGQTPKQDADNLPNTFQNFHSQPAREVGQGWQIKPPLAGRGLPACLEEGATHFKIQVIYSSATGQ